MGIVDSHIDVAKRSKCRVFPLIDPPDAILERTPLLGAHRSALGPAAHVTVSVGPTADTTRHLELPHPQGALVNELQLTDH